MERDKQFSGLSNLQQGSFRRTSKFANALSGRFFVSGISGSFQKSDKEAAVKPPPTKVVKYNCQPVLERNQQDELLKEAQKLMELEEKLAEVRPLP